MLSLPQHRRQARIDQLLLELISELQSLPESELIESLNRVRLELHAKVSPFADEPVDCVQWVRNVFVYANDYNPNSVAPPEMELLRLSIEADGYTQPIVSMPSPEGFEVVDGFHRHRVGKECEQIQSRVRGYLPVVAIRAEQYDKSNRMASTIRHNRARGKHRVEAMSEIVIELKRRNWTDDKISKNLGMEKDEILRLCQISGLSEMFRDQAFSEAWEAVGSINEDDFTELTSSAEEYQNNPIEVRAANTNDENRIFHPYDKWECYKAGFYETKAPHGWTGEQCRLKYRDFLADLDAFEAGLKKVTAEWRHSCEHYLTNAAMNRIAWLGQAAMCAAHGVPSEFRGGYSLLTESQQRAADELALAYLNRWLVANSRPVITMDEANPGRQADIY